MYKCKWFTLTRDLHAVYMAIDTYMHQHTQNRFYILKVACEFLMKKMKGVMPNLVYPSSAQ
jgi:hypothetical protein